MNAPILAPTFTLGEPAAMIGRRMPKQSLFLLVAAVLLICGLATSSLAADQPPKSAPQQRAWLLSHLVTDMQSADRYASADVAQTVTRVNNMSPAQIGTLARYYQQRKTQVVAGQVAQAEANLHRLQAYRDQLKGELARAKVIYPAEQAMAANSSALAAEQAQCALQHFDAAASRPHVLYAPHRHR